MSWRVDVTPEARQAIASFDGGLREELIERVAEFAEHPAGYLRRSLPPEPVGLWVYEYRSHVVVGMRVVLFFDAMNTSAKTIALMAIGRVMGGEEMEGD